MTDILEKITQTLSITLKHQLFIFVISTNWVSCTELYDNIVVILPDEIDTLDLTEHDPNHPFRNFKRSQMALTSVLEDIPPLHLREEEKSRIDNEDEN